MAKPITLSYQVDIAEQGFVNGDFIIQGTAINSVVTSNNLKFLSEELRSSAETLKGVPLLVDHDNSVNSIKGRVLSGTFNEIEEKVDFRAKVMDEQMKELIRDGRLNTVSVGAVVEDIEEYDGFFIPRGITFKELSLVAVPADEGATFQIALKEAYDIKGDNQLNQQEVIKMSEEAEVAKPEAPEETKAEEADEPVEEPKAETTEPEVTEEKVKSWVVEAIKSVKASDEDEKAEKPKEEPKEPKAEEAEEEEEAEEVAEKYSIVRSSHNSFTLVR